MRLRNMVINDRSPMQKKVLEKYNYRERKQISGCLALEMGAGIFQENFDILAAF